MLVTGLDFGPQWCLCDYRGSLRDIRALRMVQCDVDDNHGGFGGYMGRLRTIKSAVISITEG